MRRLRGTALPLLFLGTLACAPRPADPQPPVLKDPRPPLPPVPPPSPQPAPSPPRTVRLPARIRRLTNAELATTVAALLPGAPVWPSEMPPDARQSGFSRNGAQRVDPLYAARLQEGVRGLARQTTPALVSTLGCAQGDECARRFIDTFVARAWRRPLSSAEASDLFEVFRAGASDATFTDGIALVVEAALQAPSFLYLDELGEGTTLGPYQAASALSYLTTGGPPDPALLAAATAGYLAKPAWRESEVRRLLLSEAGRGQIQRFIREWLGIDRLVDIRKDDLVYPSFEPLRPYLLAETDDFVAEVVFRDNGTLERLLTADFTVPTRPLANFYGLPPDGTGRVSLGPGPRRGILTQASFLAVHAHADGSAPVKRGAAILERLLCQRLPPPPDPSLTKAVLPTMPGATTRSRFQSHSRDPACAGCHAIIDPVGFTFEGFDGMGGARTEENGRPVDTSADLQVNDLTGHVDGAVALVSKLAVSPPVATCFARNFFRSASALTDERLEDEYVRSVWSVLPAGRRTSVVDLYASWAASELFMTREPPR